MLRGFTVDDGSVLCGLLAESADDIILKLDVRGFVTSASQAIEHLGLDLAQYLVPPHISDLAMRSHGEAVRTYFSDAIEGMGASGGIEFPASGTSTGGVAERWYALSLRPTIDQVGVTTGALGVMRSNAGGGARGIGAASGVATVDPLTGLANRAALIAMLARSISAAQHGALMVMSIDRFRAIKLRYGQTRADEVLWAFAQFLRSMLGEMPSLSRLEGERFAVIIPGMKTSDAFALGEETVRTFAGLSLEGEGRGVNLTASAGIASLGATVDDVLGKAELALTVASGGGGKRVELADNLPGCLMARRSA